MPPSSASAVRAHRGSGLETTAAGPRALIVAASGAAVAFAQPDISSARS